MSHVDSSTIRPGYSLFWQLLARETADEIHRESVGIVAAYQEPIGTQLRHQLLRAESQ